MKIAPMILTLAIAYSPAETGGAMGESRNYAAIKEAFVAELALPEHATWSDIRRNWGHMQMGTVKTMFMLPKGASTDLLIEHLDKAIFVEAGLPPDATDEQYAELLMERRRIETARSRGLPEDATWEEISATYR